jgi:two-component system, cell cycle sensor histidine kinase and response regulator CckA
MNDRHDIRCDPSDAAALLGEIRRRDKIITALMNQVQRNLNNPDNDFSLLQTTFVLEEKVQHRTRELERARDALAEANREAEVAHHLLEERTEELQRSHSELEDRVAERTAELSQQLHFLQQLIEAIPGPVFYKDAQLRYLGCNSAFEAFVGRPASELIGKTAREIAATRELADRYAAADRKLLDKPGSQIYESPVRYANGEMRDVMFHKATFTRPDGTVGGLVGLMLDITERKLAEASVRESRQLLQDIIDNSTALIYVKDLEGRFLLINRRMEEVLRTTAFSGLPTGRESILGKADHDLFPKEQADAYRDSDQQVLAAGKVMETEDTRLHEDGLHTYISIKAPLRDEEGIPYAICGISTDITERKRLEVQLRESQKMEAMGRLAGGIAHDFNNLMTVITGYGDLLRTALKDNPSLREKVEQILSAGEQANSLTRQLLAFTRRQMLQPSLLDLKSVLVDMGNMLRRVVSEDIELVIQSGSEPCLILADCGQVQQVIMNLVINARDATPKGGRITLAVSNLMLEDPGARLPAGVQPGRYVRLTVRDTGHGMDAETQAHIFEPFFTTKEQGKGTGLGLATVYGIVQQSGGHIVVESEPGRGAAFYVYFQRTEGALPEERQAVAFELAPGTETILVVEDQDGLRTLICEILRRNGYTVLPAENGCEALLLAAKYSGRIELMITDLVMPKMGGREVAQELPVSHPETGVLYMSGYVDDINELLTLGHAFIDKPFTPEALLRKVRQVLDSESLRLSA